MTKKDEIDEKVKAETADLQEFLRHRWIDRSLPDDWNGMFLDTPIEPKKTRLTIRLDADVVRWFRKLGPGYQRAMNKVLRIYWLSLQSGRIINHPLDRTITPLNHSAQRWQNEAMLKSLLEQGIDQDDQPPEYEV